MTEIDNDNHSYCVDLVRSLKRDNFLHSLFVPTEQRNDLLALYALDAELAHVHVSVTEEVNAHIRYAWWQESLDDIFSGKPARKHPVLETLAPLITKKHLNHDTLVALVGSYRNRYPEMPNTGDQVDAMAGALLHTISPESIKGWQKAGATIDKHRTRYGKHMNLWLNLKLLWVGK
ncbi:MAG: squalene/phytoene synthase family protein [Rickettsiales bacterium]